MDCVGIGEDSQERDSRWWPCVAFIGREDLPGEHGLRRVYLPAIAHYWTEPPRERVPAPWGGTMTSRIKSAQVRLPEGPRGRLSALPTTVQVPRSAAAAAPCDGTEDGRHEWRRGVMGVRVWCDKCGCAGGLEELSLVPAPAPAAQFSGVTGAVDCFIGDAETCRKWQEIVASMSTALREHGQPDDVRDRRALYQRAADHPLDAGGRWLLPDSFTPEGARAEGERWIDLGEALTAQFDGQDEAQALWRAWLGTVEAREDEHGGDHKFQPPGDLFDAALDGALRSIGATLNDGRPAYVDARSVVAAIARTRPRWSAHVPICPTEPPRKLREMHEGLNRQTRGSLLLLLPRPPKGERDALAHVRALWGSGR